MLFERFEDTDLSQYSYAVGCPGAGKIAIVDPRRDADAYLKFAEQQGVEISHVFETHIHADFASGARELAALTGAELLISAYDEGEVFAAQFEHTPLRDGDAVEIGNVKIQALHTPGHTPEHVSYLVYDMNRSREVPELFLTGDFLFVGSIGRPDLLGEEAKGGLANQLYDSIQRLRELPDLLEVYPAHGSESMCGAGISGRAMSTLGYERIANPYLRPELGRDDFIAEVLGNVPPFPEYYKRMKRLNSDGAPDLHGRDAPHPIEVHRFKELADAGHVVVDLRSKESYAGSHLPGSLYVGHRPSMWGAWIIPYETPILLVADNAEQAAAAQIGLARVGLDDVRGVLMGGLTGGLDAWEEAGFDITSLDCLSPRDLRAKLVAGENVSVLDIRGNPEWATGHIEGASHVVAGYVQDRLDEVPAGGTALALVCNTGFQSTVVASVLERSGRRDLLNVFGGMAAWREAELPLGLPETQPVT